MEVLGDRALDALAGAGARVRPRRRGTCGWIRTRSRTLVALAPREFRLHARNPDRDVVFGGANLVFCAVGGPAFVSDLDRGRRPGNIADFRDYVRLIGALDVIHQEGGGPLEPTDLPVETRHLDQYQVFATELDKTWHCLGTGRDRRRRRDRGRLPDARRVDATTLVREPSLITIINTNSPLRLDGPMSDGLIEMALHGQPVVATPFTLAGAMSPVSLAGAIAQQNAEALFMVALAQIVRPGAPMVYGAFTSNVDMRTGSPAFGTPESVKSQFAIGAAGAALRPAVAVVECDGVTGGRCAGGLRGRDGRLGRRDGRGQPAVPGRRLAGGRPDGVVREADHRRGDPADDLGGAATARGVRGVARVRRDRRGRARAGTSSGRPTRSSATRPRSTQPLVSDWRNFETWQADGSRTATERANGLWKRLLAEAVPPPLDRSIAEALDAFVVRRKREITSGA